MRNLVRNTWKSSTNCLYKNVDTQTPANMLAMRNDALIRNDATIRLRHAPAPMSDWTYRVAALAAALLLLATAGGALYGIWLRSIPISSG